MHFIFVALQVVEVLETIYELTYAFIPEIKKPPRAGAKSLGCIGLAQPRLRMQVYWKKICKLYK
jgi:hypothetical protein